MHKCLVFSCSLFQKSVGTDETTDLVANRFEFQVDKSKEAERLLKLGVEIVYSGIGVVFCQRQVRAFVSGFLPLSDPLLTTHISSAGSPPPGLLP